MTVRFLKEFLDPLADTDDVVLYVDTSGTQPVRSIRKRDLCYACGGDGRSWTPRHDPKCPLCKGTGKKSHVILSDFE